MSKPTIAEVFDKIKTARATHRVKAPQSAKLREMKKRWPNLDESCPLFAWALRHGSGTDE